MYQEALGDTKLTWHFQSNMTFISGPIAVKWDSLSTYTFPSNSEPEAHQFCMLSKICGACLF